MGLTKINNNQIHFQDPIAVIFIPWVMGAIGTQGYDIHDIVGDTFSLTQEDAERNEIPWEFGDEPLQENVSLGNRNITMQCLDYQNKIMTNLFGWTEDSNGDFVWAPTQYEESNCTIILQFANKAIVMPKVKMDSKTVFENLRTDIARGELGGVLYSTEVLMGDAITPIETGFFFMKNGQSFKIGQTTVSISADGVASLSHPVNVKLNTVTNGSVSGINVGDNTVTAGTSLTLTATPSSGYLFEKWTINGETFTTPTVTITVTEDTEITVSFVAGVKLDFTAGSNGNVFLNQGTTPLPTGDYYFMPSTSLTLTATPSSGYLFDKWTIDGETLTTPTVTITVTEDTEVTVAFAAVVNLEFTAGSNGDVFLNEDTTPLATGSYSFKSGDTISLEAVAATDYELDSWTVNDSSETNNPLELTISADTTVSVAFKTAL